MYNFCGIRSRNLRVYAVNNTTFCGDTEKYFYFYRFLRRPCVALVASYRRGRRVPRLDESEDCRAHVPFKIPPLCASGLGLSYFVHSSPDVSHVLHHWFGITYLTMFDRLELLELFVPDWRLTCLPSFCIIDMLFRYWFTDLFCETSYWHYITLHHWTKVDSGPCPVLSVSVQPFWFNAVG